MISLTPEEREKFATYLEQQADEDKILAQKCDDLGHRDMAKKLRMEVVSKKIVASVLRSIESQSVG